MRVLDTPLQLRETIALAGNTTAIFGPSGSGKSRLLRAIAGVDWKDSARPVGRIEYAGTTLLDSNAGVYMPMHERPVAYVAQAPALFPHLSVEGNITYAVKRAFPGGPTLQRLAGLLDLSALLQAKPGTLSGGEQQRVALARALARGARLLLLDEPMAALDRSRKLELMTAIEAIQAELGISVLLVSHAIEEVMRLASHTLAISGGQVLAHGPTLEVFDTIDQSAAMGLFEAGSLLEGTVLRHDTAHQLTYIDLGGCALSMPLLERLAIASPIRLRIRARDVAIALEKPQQISIRNILPATYIRARGKDGATFVEVHLDVSGRKLTARITRAALAELAPQPGAQVYALIKSVSFDRRMV
jgi:molybdate transport system ATP-binding protein